MVIRMGGSRQLQPTQRGVLIALIVLAASAGVHGFCDSCTTTYKPVCGKDGQTYANSCVLGCASVPLAYEGKCKYDCMPQTPNCDGDFDSTQMVCINGLTYMNKAEAMCDGFPSTSSCYTSGVCKYNIRSGSTVSYLTTPEGTGGSVKAAGANTAAFPTTSPKYNYGEALTKAMLFYDSQVSGKIAGSSKKRLSWRSDSCTSCIGKNSKDLSGGFYEAGGAYLKFSLLNSYMASMLAWSAIEFKDGYVKTGTWNDVKWKIRWAADYLRNSHVSEYEYAAWIGNTTRDYDYFGPPEKYEQYIGKRSSDIGYITKTNKGSEVLGDAAAALAATSKLFRINGQNGYADLYLGEARKLYAWAKAYPGSYQSNPSPSIQDMANCYNSNGYNDEMGWAAIWLYAATSEAAYLTDAKSYFSKLKFVVGDETIELNNRYVPLAIMLAKYDSGNSIYFTKLNGIFDAYLTQKTIHTPRGLAYDYHWGAARFGGNLAFLGWTYAKNAKVSSSFRNRLKNYGAFQLNYLLGDSGRSWMVGFGKNSPQRVWHKSSLLSYLEDYSGYAKKIYSIPDYGPWASGTGSAYLEKGKFFVEGSTTAQKYTVFGHFVTPLYNDNLVNTRKDYSYTEWTIEYSTGIVGGLAALAQNYGSGPYTGSMPGVGPLP